jgi:hypothetical protein
MPRYFPIQLNVKVQASASDMVALHWRSSSVIADFVIPQDKFSFLRVRFDKAYIVRVLDEMPLSTEEGGSDYGSLRDHLAYRVEEARFWNTQSETFKFTHKDAQHYRFVTGNTCLDVIAGAAPVIRPIPAGTGPSEISA